MHPRDSTFFSDAAGQASRAAGQSLTFAGLAAFGPDLVAARFRLDNGLTIVVAPNDRVPVFAYQTWFRVGSKDEDPGRTGLAHLFEHLMFKGTERYAAGTFDLEMERRGSQTNAATWVDWTYYTEALAARGDNLATVVGFEVDRMTGLVLDEDTFRSELEVVKNERRMAVEDSVSGTLSERLLDLMFQQHPYRWPTIGSMAHLEAASLDDLRAFYAAYYAPNNATVVLTGAMDLVPTLTLLARSYGPVPAQLVPRRQLPTEPPQTAPRRAVLHRPLLAPQLTLGFRAPAQSHPDFPALEILGEVLVSGDSARLYRRLVVDDQVATEVGGFLAPFAEPGLFELHVTLRPGVDPDHVITVVQSELDSLASGIGKGELQKAHHGLELGLLEALKDVESCAEALGHFETNYHDFGMAFRTTEAFARVTADGLKRVARQVFASPNRSAVIALPGASED